MDVMKTVATNSQNGVQFHRGILPNVYMSVNKTEKEGHLPTLSLLTRLPRSSPQKPRERLSPTS